MKIRLYLCLLLLLFSSTLLAQKQANNWIFGSKAGLTWNILQTFEAKRLDNQATINLKRIPTAIPINKFENSNYMEARSSSFALSDKYGNLQLYSDGTSYWGKTFRTFYNGSFGISSTQGGLLMPIKPSSNYQTEFIAIIPGSGYSGIDYMKIGFSYFYPNGTISVTRRALGQNNGYMGEVATIALKPNKKDMWVIAPRMYQNKPQLCAWLLNESGDNQIFYTPVISEMVTLPTSFPSGISSLHTGFIRLSPDSQHFVWGTNNGYTILGNFDIETGQASHVKYINVNGYGVEFSRSGNYVYISVSNGEVRVYETTTLLSASDPNTIVPIYTYNSGTRYATALQLAPDGRIYQPIYNTRSLIVVNKPELVETDPEVYILENILPDGGKVYSGLCNFSGSWFGSEIEGVEECCAGGEEIYSYSYAGGLGTDNIAYTMWDFGDNKGKVQVDVSTSSLSGIVNCPYVYEKPGTYTIKVYSYTSQGQLLNETMEYSVIVNLCVVKVNPHLRINVK